MSTSLTFRPLSARPSRFVVPRRCHVSCGCSASKHSILHSSADASDVFTSVSVDIAAITAVEPQSLGTLKDDAEKEWLSRPVGGVSTKGGEQLLPVSKLADAQDLHIPSPSLTDRFLASAPVLYYLDNLEKHPLATKCWTSFTGFFIGDVVAQLLTEPDFIFSRTLILAGYGFFIDAPVGNAFYHWIDATIHPENPKSARAVGKKIAIDQLIYAPILTFVFYAFLCSAHLEFDAIPATIESKVWPTLMANWCVWPLAHSLNFYFVPTEQRILYNNFVAVCWTTWLSFISH